jgi:hypothetical protein
MKQNMGLLDRILRVVAAFIIAFLYFMGQISGIAAIILGAFAVIFLFTSSLGFCPLYLPLKFSTKKDKKTGNS